MITQAGYEPLFIGHFHDGENWHFLPHSYREVRRAMHACLRVLDSFHFPQNSRALVIASYEDWALTLPIEWALTANKTTIFNADASPFEAQRIESFIRRFDPQIVLGVNAAVLQGLEAAGHDIDRLFAGRSVWTRDAEARERLLQVEAACGVYRWSMVGPAIGMECREAAGLHIDGQEWDVQARESSIVVSSRLGRQLPGNEQETGVTGSLETNVCRCGSPDPRVVPGH